MSFRTFAVAALALTTAAVAGCADNQSVLGNSANLTTSAVTPATRVDPACASLSAQIETLRKEGIADKVEKATQKKTKVSLTAAETAKADQLNKANFEFQSKCSNYKPQQAAAVQPAAAKPVASAASPSY